MYSNVLHPTLSLLPCGTVPYDPIFTYCKTPIVSGTLYLGNLAFANFALN